jgi:membrane associated rhomboid family serine protease
MVPLNLTTGALIGLMVIAAAIINFVPRLQQKWAFCPYEVWHKGEWYRLITAVFVHVNLLHLLFNAVTLFFFGRTLEYLFNYFLGPSYWIWYLGLFLLSAVGGQLFNLWRHKDNPYFRSVGASGGVVGVLFSFILLSPDSKLYLFFIPVPIPAYIFAIGFVGYSVYGIYEKKGKIDHAAHLGGGVIGVLFTLLAIPGAWQYFLNAF